MIKNFEEYEVLLNQFLEKKISTEIFQIEFINLFKSESRHLDDHLYNILEEIFGDCDALSDDPELLLENPSFYINEVVFRERMFSAKRNLQNYVIDN